MKSVQNQNKKNALILFLLWPFFACIIAIRHYRSLWAKNIVWLFIIFSGFTFVITKSGDANRYRDRFLWMGQFDWSFGNFFSLLYSEETRYVDIVEPLTSFLLSRITSDYRILLAVFGLIFGYFYTRNIWYLLERAGPRIRSYNFPLIITFAVIVGFWQINGFRFWTAAHVFLFGALPYLIEGKKKTLWIAVLSVFFHFSFMLPIAVLLIYMLLGNRYMLLGKRVHIFFYFFIISFFIKEINFEIVRHYLGYFPDFFVDRTSDYLSEAIIERIAGPDGRSWHARYYGEVLLFAVVSLATVAYFNIKNLMAKNNWLVNLFSFSLFFIGVFNILNAIPSVGRFLVLGNLFMVAFFFLYFQHDMNIRRNKEIMFLLLPAIALFCVVAIRGGFEYMGLFTVLGNPITALFGPGETSLISLIK